MSDCGPDLRRALYAAGAARDPALVQEVLRGLRAALERDGRPVPPEIDAAIAELALDLPAAHPA